jgi:hypothetical protein
LRSSDSEILGPGVSLSCSQEPATIPYTEPDKSSPHCHTVLLRSDRRFKILMLMDIDVSLLTCNTLKMYVDEPAPHHRGLDLRPSKSCRICGGQSGTRFLRVLRSFCQHHSNGSAYSYIIWGMNSRPVGGRSSETYSHPTDMNIYG